mmetsp:Transcript_63472/g.175953  ORF Transcript_63472/g.175953 Transcript_63472/m.175953 type:complete len:247 (+) Transcript_63472:1298-2038(+)
MPSPSCACKAGSGPTVATFRSCMTSSTLMPGRRPSWRASTTPALLALTAVVTPSRVFTSQMGSPAFTKSYLATRHFTNSAPAGTLLADDLASTSSGGKRFSSPTSTMLRSSVKAVSRCMPVRSFSCRDTTLPDLVALTHFSAPVASLTFASGAPTSTLSPTSTRYSTKMLPCGAATPVLLDARDNLGKCEIVATLRSSTASMGSPGLRALCVSFTMPSLPAVSISTWPSAVCTSAMGSPRRTASPG